MFPAHPFVFPVAPHRQSGLGVEAAGKRTFAKISPSFLGYEAMVWLQLVLVAAFVSFAALLSLAAWRAMELAVRADRLFPSLDQGKIRT